MKKALIIFSVLMLSFPALVSADVVAFRIGYFIPRAESDLWDIEFENMDFTKSNYQTTGFSFAYEYFLTPQVSVVMGIDGYNRQKVGLYRDWVGYQDFDGDWAYPNDYVGDFIPSHVYSVSITPVQVSVKLSPLGRRARIIPYVGGGVGLYVWSVKLQGDLVDFSDEWFDTAEQVTIYPILQIDAREDSKFSFGFHAFAGISVPVANRISIDGQFKYNVAKGSFSDTGGFEGFENFDLSGYQISVGLNYWF